MWHVRHLEFLISSSLILSDETTISDLCMKRANIYV